MDLRLSTSHSLLSRRRPRREGITRRQLTGRRVYVTVHHCVPINIESKRAAGSTPRTLWKARTLHVVLDGSTRAAASPTIGCTAELGWIHSMPSTTWDTISRYWFYRPRRKLHYNLSVVPTARKVAFCI